MNQAIPELASLRQVTDDIDPGVAALLFESSNDWMWVIDAAGRHVFSNRAIERILGYGHEEILQIADFVTLVHPDDRGRIAALLEQAVVSRTGWRGEVFRWRHKDGSHRWLESDGMPMFAATGELTGFCGADRDVTERIAQEQRIAASERLFRTTFERAGVGMAHLDLDGSWLRVNQPLCDMLAYSADELMCFRFQDITHPEDLEADLAQAKRLFAGEISAYSMEKRYIRKDGEIVWGMLTRSVVRDDEGVPQYAIAVVRDITDRKMAEAVRRQSERDYRTLFENTHDVLLVVDPQTGTIINANVRAATVYGCPREELIGMPMSQLSMTFARAKESIDELLRSGADVRFETVHRRRDGTAIELDVIAATVKYQGRDAVLNTCRDVTEERRLLRALSASELRFRSLVEHGYDMIAVTDEQGIIRFLTGSVSSTLGYAPEELLGATLGTHIHPDDRGPLAEAFSTAVQSESSRPGIICRVRRKDGTWRWCEGIGANLLKVEGVEGIVIVARDVTERRELELRLEQARRVESLGRVAATVAHEFNNLLMSISPAAQLLRRRHADSPDVVRIAEQLRGVVKRGSVITGDILRFSQPNDPVRERIDLHETLTAILQDLRPLLGERIELDFTVEPSLLIDADAVQFHQLISNLVLNARDAMPDGGTIRISGARLSAAGAGRCVEIAIHDSGPGVPPELQSRIFEPLFTTKRKGTGLGLALCQQVAAAHGGSISVENHPQGGALFRVRVPCAS
jgi:PAS domain S-box-containing protein